MILQLRELLKQKKLSSIEFSRQMGVSKSTVSYWLNGKVFPGEETIQKIADTLGVPVCRLFAPGGKCQCEECPDVPSDYRRRFLKSVTDLKELIREWEVAETLRLTLPNE